MHVSKLKRVEGELLTIIEASIPEKKQCEAVKSLVRKSIGYLYSWADFEPLSTEDVNHNSVDHQNWLKEKDKKE